ncbi:MAG TPA: AIR synthase-related protein, partial [Candidatus Acidoferrum sp.]|nr:AIR synthase-related protein [Candidatus Acidoferrum sp.]
ELAAIVIESMAQLNQAPSELMVTYGAHAATDITGYGLLGHAYEMAAASQVSIRIFSKTLPLLPQALELAAKKMIPGGANDNREFLVGHVKVTASIDPNLEVVLYDPQTSGGLFIAMSPQRADEFQQELKRHHLPDQPVGQVERPGEVELIVE